VSTYVQIIALACLPFLIPRVRQRVKAAPFAAGVVTLLVLSAAIELLPLHDIYYNVRHRNPVIALELLAAGWIMFFARKRWQKLLATAAVLLAWFQNFGMVEPNITVLMLGGSLSVLWGLGVSLPPRATRALLAFGSLSLFVYIAHVPILYGLGRFVPPGAMCFALLVGMSIIGGSLLERVSIFVGEHITLVARKWWTRTAGADPSAHSLGGASELLTGAALALEQANGGAPARAMLTEGKPQ
jgi:peptidoglycan/LPS O-acetylase OafA/YrhL